MLTKNDQKSLFLSDTPSVPNGILLTHLFKRNENENFASG